MYYIVVNPVSQSGRGKRYFNKIEPIFKEKKIPYKVFFSEYHGHISEIVEELTYNAEHTDEDLNLMILGGDGTMNEALQGIHTFDKVNLIYIPTGSSNDLARALGISRKPIEALCHVLEHPQTCKIDIGTIHCENSLVRDGQMTIPDRRFIVSCGIGYDAAICQEALISPIKDFFNRCGLGKLTYLGIALKQLIRTKYITGELTLNDNETIIPLQKLLFIAGMNHPYEGGGFMFAPKAVNNDRLINICSITQLSKWKILRILPTAFKGNHYRFRGIDGYTASGYTVRTSTPLWVHTDGEVEAKADFISVKYNDAQIRLTY